MKKKITYLYYMIKGYVRQISIKKCNSAKIYSNSLRKYNGKDIMSKDDANIWIKQMIESGEPFMAARFGAFELLNMWTYEFNINDKKKAKRFNYLCNNAGFFPKNIDLLKKYTEIMIESCKEVDLQAIWFHKFEDYYINKYMKKDIVQTYLLDFEPWSSEKYHWSSALEDKRVLVIHPFDNTINSQFKNREKLFVGSNILPNFELITLKSVQTIAGNKDLRFSDWFQALDYMTEEALKINFDIAIIGCGAYGYPLAARLKRAGKQAIHLGGATQIMFGIKGNRWEKNKEFEYVSKWFNEYWTKPLNKDVVKNKEQIEDSCYW